MAPSWRMASQIWGLKVLFVRPRGSTHLQRPSLVTSHSMTGAAQTQLVKLVKPLITCVRWLAVYTRSCCLTVALPCKPCPATGWAVHSTSPDRVQARAAGALPVWAS